MTTTEGVLARARDIVTEIRPSHTETRPSYLPDEHGPLPALVGDAVTGQPARMCAWSVCQSRPVRGKYCRGCTSIVVSQRSAELGAMYGTRRTAPGDLNLFACLGCKVVEVHPEPIKVKGPPYCVLCGAAYSQVGHRTIKNMPEGTLFL